MGPVWGRGEGSILSIKVSRTLRSTRFLGQRSLMITARPAQNTSGLIPVLGAASLAMKSNRTGAIFNPWASIRVMIGFLKGNGGLEAAFSLKQLGGVQKGGRFRSPFSAKAGGVRRPPIGMDWPRILPWQRPCERGRERTHAGLPFTTALRAHAHSLAALARPSFAKDSPSRFKEGAGKA